MDFLNSAVGTINDFLWTYIIIVVLVGCGLWFTLSTKLVQLRALPEMVRLLTGDLGRRPSGRKAISSFQAFCVSTASRVGVGNIAGVATAIAFGGPGAVFWMWAVALSAVGFVYAGRREWVAIYAPVILLWATLMVAAPTVTPFRYMVPIIMVVPIGLAVLLGTDRATWEPARLSSARPRRSPSPESV